VKILRDRDGAETSVGFWVTLEGARLFRTGDGRLDEKHKVGKVGDCDGYFVPRAVVHVLATTTLMRTGNRIHEQ
jgi:hypothetical protein